MFEAGCSKQGKSQQGPEMQVELGTEGFLLQAAGKLSSLGKHDPGNAAKVPES